VAGRCQPFASRHRKIREKKERRRRGARASTPTDPERNAELGASVLKVAKGAPEPTVSRYGTYRA